MARRKHSADASPTRPGPTSSRLAWGRREASPRNRSGTVDGGKGGPVARTVEERRDEAPEVLALPSSLGLERHASAARSGRAALEERVSSHNETGPAMTSGDVDADWVAAYSVGDETPGGDNPTPDQDVVDEIGKALGVEYSDEEELDGDRVVERDRHRWELDPASSEDYQERVKPAPRPRRK